MHAVKQRGLCVAAAYTAVILFSSCSGNRLTEVQGDLEPAKQFRAFPLYYLGLSFEKYPMTNDGHKDVGRYMNNPKGPIAFGYGHCDLPSGPEPSCLIPISIVNLPRCVSLDRYAGHLPGGTRPDKVERFRGVRLETYSEGGPLYNLRLYTDKTTIAISSEIGHAAARRMAHTLRSINSRIHPGARLPSPRPNRNPPFGGCPDRRVRGEGD